MKIAISRLNHVSLQGRSGEKEKARWFYGTLLGLKEIPLPKKLADLYDALWFQFFDINIHLVFSKNYEIPPIQYQNGVVLPHHHMGIEVKDIHSVRKELEKNQVKIIEGVGLPNGDHFYLLDPRGNFLEFVEYHPKRCRGSLQRP